ncbi:MAG: GNAT family N-acetyltransferase [Richelia sp. RM2_1_2]|nr:GNAT family N-acetyltransferase [Richelia sp. SM2_1_7]NJM17735.1 GNAT family N-acetyltransferase [Richelia sp. SM1_7_0]NJN08231.1 GNAT family N-acetyltransferase [Richelia sp. RM1_1_1]NJO61124.1 GNAT family N-acetyltransferase [Richelia sp. RM2_1_2]
MESITAKTTPINTPQILRIGTPQEFFAQMVLERLPISEKWLYRVYFGLTENAIAQLLEGGLDAVIATQKIARTDLEYQLIHEESFWLVGSPQLNIPNTANIQQLEEDLRSPSGSYGASLIAYGEELPIIRRFWRVVFGKRLDLVPRIVLPDLRLIHDAIALGYGFSVLPDYLCIDTINSGKLQVLLKPNRAVTNQIWLAYRKSERESGAVRLLLDAFQTLKQIAAPDRESFKISQLEKEHALAIINWRYSSPYDYYNFDAETIQEDLHYLIDPKNDFWAILNLQGELEGYCSFGSDGQVPGGDYSNEALDIGMGIRPDLVGQGRGKQYAQAVIGHGTSQYRVQQLRVTIAQFNKRAQRVWAQLGFKQVQKFIKIGSGEEFVVFIRKVSV